MLTQRTFLNPTVVHFIGVFIASAVALSAGLPPLACGGLVFAAALFGLCITGTALGRLVTGKARVQHWMDYLTYGALPIAAYLALIASAVGLALDHPAGVYGLAASALALLLIGIAAAWDLATWLASHRRI